MPPKKTRRTRGPNKGRAWSRASDTDGQVSVIRIQLDVTDPVMRSRVERLYADCHQLRRTLQKQARSRVDAYWRDRTNRPADPKGTRERYGLDRKSLETAAKQHLDAAPHLMGGCTKALGLHLADSVWTQVERHLFTDKSGRRHGRPRVGRWFDFGRIPGRAKSHTTARKWETFRLHGTIDGHRTAYTDADGRYWQPRKMRPVTTSGSWWEHDGPLVLVMTGLGVGDLVLPVRLPASPCQQPFVEHHLSRPELWHKIDLVRHRDPHSRGGWRYEAQLMVLVAPYVAPPVTERRAAVPTNRRAGVDVNVSNVTLASHIDGEHLTISRVAMTAEQKAAEAARRKKERGRAKALDRSRRAANPRQYRLSKRQQRDADRRRKAGLEPKQVVPSGARVTRADGKPTQAYRRDRLSRGYRQGRAVAARDTAATSRARRDQARTTAAELVATHGVDLVIEDCDLRTWARQWGRSLHAFAPGTLVAAIAREIDAVRTQRGIVHGGLRKAATWSTALSQRCMCGRRQKKPLGQRTHVCPDCDLVGDRDAVSATLAGFVIVADDPKAATVDVESAREALQHPATWHILNQTCNNGRQEARSASTDTTPTRRTGGTAVERPPTRKVGSARRTRARPHPQPSKNRKVSRERAWTRTGRPRDGDAHAPPSRDIS